MLVLSRKKNEELVIPLDFVHAVAERLAEKYMLGWTPQQVKEFIREQVGDEIRLMVVDIRGDKVRLGVHAANGVAVHRLEVWEAIQSGAA